MKNKISKLLFALFVVSIVFILGCSTNNIVQQTTNSQDTSSPSSSGGQQSTMISNQDTGANGDVSVIIIKDFAFNPSSISVSKGTTVKWINQDSTAHTIKSDTVNSEQIGSGGSFEFKFDTPGTYDYICGIHTSMKGRIIVN